MDSTYALLAQRVLDKWEQKKKTQSSPGAPCRLLVALAGPPGSGKTTIAQRVVEIINNNDRRNGGGPKTVAISADGFHLPLATLRGLPNAQEALARRGAPWTFDAAAVVALAAELRSSTGIRPVETPTFDHAVKDPVPGGLTIPPDVEVCILEGNYLLAGQAPWGDIAGLVDDRWLVQVEPALARGRVAARHLAAGIESTIEAALKRTEENDMVNGQFVAEESRGRCDLVIDSVEEFQSGK